MGNDWEFMDSSGAVQLVQYTRGNLTNLATPGLFVYEGNAGRASGLAPKVEGCMLGMTSSASAVTIYIDDASASFGAAASHTLVEFDVGQDSEGNFNGFTSLFCNVIWNTALSAGDVAKARAEMAAAFSRGPAATQVIQDGNSLYTGYQSTCCDTVLWYAQQYLPKPVSIINMSLWGQTAANSKANFANNIAGLFDLTKPKRIYAYSSSFNDITAGGKTGAQVYSTLTDLCGLARDAGATHTQLETIFYTGSAYRTQVDDHNDRLRAGVGTDFDYLLDGVNEDTRIDFDDPLYSPDGDHFSSLGQLYCVQDHSAQRGLWLS
jgi:hypothetical protein